MVEDQEETAAALKRKLEAECYAVDVKHDGDRGFYKARTNDYDLILLDVQLPDIDAWAARRRPVSIT